MGQARSRYETPGGFWHRRRPKTKTQQPSPESFVKMSPPPPEPDQSSVQMDQSSAHADMSSITANTTPASAAPFPDMHGDAVAETNGMKAGDVDKTEQQASSPHDKPSASLHLDVHGDVMMETCDNKADELDKVGIDSTEQQTSNPPNPPTADQPTQPVQEPPPKRPALKREFTPPHRIQIWSHRAWQIEHAYSSVHRHVTKTLNEIRDQQVNSNRTGAAARRTELDIYNTADSCTLSLEYLVGHFSTGFFHYGGPENILGMMATIDADAAKLDDLRLKQRQMANYGINLEKKIVQTEGHIRELAELAKRIKEKAAAGEEVEEYEDEDEDEDEHEDGDEDMDADGDSDPDFDGMANGGANHS